MTKLRELWRKLYTTLYLDTLVARLLILFLLAFAVIQIANSVLLSELRMYHKKLGVQEAAMRMAVYARTLEMLPKAERQNYIDLLTHIYSDGRDATEDLFGLSDEKPDLKEIDSKPAHTYAAALKRNFRQAGMERNFIVQPIGGDQIPHKDYPVPYMVTAIELSDGTWATVAHRRDHGQEAPWIYRRAASMVIVVLALLAMGLVLHSTKPLRRLAAGAEAFGRSPEFSEPLSETGSREIREVSQSFNRMRERICATSLRATAPFSNMRCARSACCSARVTARLFISTVSAAYNTWRYACTTLTVMSLRLFSTPRRLLSARRSCWRTLLRRRPP